MAKKKEALVVFHLSSLDSFYDGLERFGPTYRNLGWTFAELLALRILSHEGPVIVIDEQLPFEKGTSEPRQLVLKAMEQRPDIIVIRHDEMEGYDDWYDPPDEPREIYTWDDLIVDLHRLLVDDLKVDKVKVAGLYYAPEVDSGCAWYGGNRIKEFLPVEFDEPVLAPEV
jgi:hypothetical protein